MIELGRYARKTIVFIAFSTTVLGLTFFPFINAEAATASVQTLPATQITATDAILNGSVYLPGIALPSNSPYQAQPQVQYRFAFGNDPALIVADHTNFSLAGSVAIGQTVFSSVTNLAAGTPYYYRIEVTLPNGSVMAGDTLSFNTLGNQGGVPIARTLAPDILEDGTVVMKGQINPASFTPQYWFEYSFSPLMIFSGSTPFQFSGNISGYIDVSQAVPGLTRGQMYYYRIVVQTLEGTVYGDVMSFGIPSSGGATAAGISSGGSPSGRAGGVAGGPVRLTSESVAGGQTLYPRHPHVATAGYPAPASTISAAATAAPANSQGAFSSFNKTSGKISANSAALIDSFSSFLGSSGLLFFLCLILAALVAYEFISRKKRKESNVMKLGALRIVD